MAALHHPLVKGNTEREIFFLPFKFGRGAEARQAAVEKTYVPSTFRAVGKWGGFANRA